MVNVKSLLIFVAILVALNFMLSEVDYGVHISIVGKRAILLVIFDDRSSLGLVRLRVKRASGDMENIFDRMTSKASEEVEASPAALSPFSEITDEDIDALFSE